MRINYNTSVSFQRRLRKNEEADYFNVLKEARETASGQKNGKNILILPASSLPQSSQNNTGVGNLNSDESQRFFDFTKKYWGINEIQLLPIGQCHKNHEQYPLYSGSSMDFGNYIIDAKEILSNEDFKKLVNTNNISDRVNFSNVVDSKSEQEKLLKNIYNELPLNMQLEFEYFKRQNANRLEAKSIFYALTDLYGTHNTKNWAELDANLYDETIVPAMKRKERIAVLKKMPQADFYLFKQFLAEKHFLKAKDKLNKKGIKLFGDMPCGFSADEKWAHPKAFLKDYSIGWGLPALDFKSKEAEEILREKTKFYAKYFDGFRVDAAWTYTEPVIINPKAKQLIKFDWQDKFLKIIEEETIKTKGNNFDLSNIIYEFTADPNHFSMFDKFNLKPYIAERMQYITSDYIKEDWGCDSAFKRRGWKNYVLGASNHDSHKIEYSKEQADILSQILKIPSEKLKTYSEFLKAKFAEPMSSKNVMLFFMHALGMGGQYKDNPAPTENYTAKIPANFEDFYHNALQKGEAFNPMDALEKQFIAQGLDKEKPELFNKIKKYRKILEQTETKNTKMFIIAGSIALIGVVAASWYLFTHKTNSNQHQ